MKLLIILHISVFVASTFLPSFLKDFLHNYGSSIRLIELSCNKKKSLSILKNVIHFHSVGIQNINTNFFIPANNLIYSVNLLCPSSVKLFENANNQKLFNAPYKWIIYHNLQQSNENIIEKYFRNYNILPDSNLILAKEQNGVFEFVKFFKKHPNLAYTIEYFGKWCETNKFSSNFPKISLEKRRNLSQITLNVAFVITDNYTLDHLTDYRNKQTDFIPRLSYTVYQLVCEAINASCNTSIHYSWGFYNPKTGWNGMFGDMVADKAEIGGTSVFLTLTRLEAVEYTPISLPTRTQFIFRKPKLSYVANIYVLPFSKHVWICTFFLILILILVLFVTMKWHALKTDQKHTLQDSSLLDASLITIGAVCQQGCPETSTDSPGRIVKLFLFIFVIYLFTSYSANIVALQQSTSNSIQTLEDLLNSYMEVGVKDSDYFHFYMPKSSDPVGKALYLQKIAPAGKPSHYMPALEGIRRMRDTPFAFYIGRSEGYSLVANIFQEDQKCGFHEIKYLQMQESFFTIKRNSSYKEIIKNGLYHILERGLLKRDLVRRMSTKPICTTNGISFVSVNLLDCYHAFVLLAGGILMSIAIFAIEILLKYRKKLR